MNHYEILNKIKQCLIPEFQIITIALYGSCMYKSLADTRDIDAYAIIKNRKFQTGRVDIYISLGNHSKRASVYLISEQDLYDDIYEQKFGGRWAILFYHGYVCCWHDKECFCYYRDSMSAIIYQYNLELCPSPAEFYLKNNLYICEQFPFYLKSSLDFYVFSELRILNYSLFEKIWPSIIGNKGKIVYNRNPNRLHDYLITEFLFRDSSIGTVRNLNSKFDAIINLINRNQEEIIRCYGIEDYNFLIKCVHESINLIDRIKVEDKNTFPFSLKYYGKKYI